MLLVEFRCLSHKDHVNYKALYEFGYANSTTPRALKNAPPISYK